MCGNPVALWISFALGVIAGLLSLVHVFQRGTAHFQRRVTLGLSVVGLAVAIGSAATFLLSALPWIHVVRDALDVPLKVKLSGMGICILVGSRFLQQTRTPRRLRWWEWLSDSVTVGSVLLYTLTYTAAGSPSSGASVLFVGWLAAGPVVIADVVFPVVRRVASRLDKLLSTAWGVPLVALFLAIVSSLLATLDSIGMFG